MTNKLSAEQFEKIEFPGGTFFRANKNQFPALHGLAVQMLKLKPGAVREPHSHPNAEQLDFCVSGHARVGIIGPGGNQQLLDLSDGDISFVPRGYIHWIENVGSGQLHFLVILSDELPETIELSETLGGVPADTLATALGISEQMLDKLPKKAVTIGAGANM